MGIEEWIELLGVLMLIGIISVFIDLGFERLVKRWRGRDD